MHGREWAYMHIRTIGSGGLFTKLRLVIVDNNIYDTKSYRYIVINAYVVQKLKEDNILG